MVARQADKTKVSFKSDLLSIALRICFFWYNLMPLSRGTAAIGQISLHAILLSCGLEITSSIPEGFQPDWEAILTPTCEVFEASMTKWLVVEHSDLLGSVPSVNAVVATVGDALVVLNTIGK